MTKVISVHADHRDYGGGSIRRIMEYVQGDSSPIILVGDFNKIPPILPITGDGDFIDTGRVAQSESAADARRGTFAKKRIDYVFVQPRYFEVLDSGLATGEHAAASDHRAYYTRIAAKTP